MPSPIQNFTDLARNPYPGRGIILGLDEKEENLVQIYWIMGRSDRSRNRVFGLEREKGRLFTDVADPSRGVDATLGLYTAMHEWDGHVFVVSNGDHTDIVMNRIGPRGFTDFDILLAGVKHEPDPPIYTPRITGLTYFRHGQIRYKLGIIRRTPSGDREFEQFCYGDERQEPGIGHCITTYTTDGNPPPPFTGNPPALPLKGGIHTILDTYWDALNPENRVSLAVKFIPIGGGMTMTVVRNRFSKV